MIFLGEEGGGEREREREYSSAIFKRERYDNAIGGRQSWRSHDRQTVFMRVRASEASVS